MRSGEVSVPVPGVLVTGDGPELISLIGMTVAWPLVAHAQQPDQN